MHAVAPGKLSLLIFHWHSGVLRLHSVTFSAEPFPLSYLPLFFLLCSFLTVIPLFSMANRCLHVPHSLMGQCCYHLHCADSKSFFACEIASGALFHFSFCIGEQLVLLSGSEGKATCPALSEMCFFLQLCWLN